MENEKNIGNEVRVSSGILTRLENFWYHYKWHSLIALFLVFTVTICTLQMCDKEKYDVNVLYAGGHAFSRESEGADYSEYQKIMSSMKNFTEDHDGDGKISVSFRDLYLPTEEELAKEEDDVYFIRQRDEIAKHVSRKLLAYLQRLRLTARDQRHRHNKRQKQNNKSFHIIS
jgi:hypothetical protein